MGQFFKDHKRLLLISTIITTLATVVIAVTPFLHKTQPATLHKTQPATPKTAEAASSTGKSNAPPKERYGDARTLASEFSADVRKLLREAAKLDESEIQAFFQTEDSHMTKENLEGFLLLMNQRDFSEIVKQSDTLLPNEGFRLRARAYVLQGETAKAAAEFDLESLSKEGYPLVLDEGYYKSWNSLEVNQDIMTITDALGQELGRVDLESYIEGDPSKVVWNYESMESIRDLIGDHEATHPYCCFRKFLIEGYSPHEIFSLIQLDLIEGRHEIARRRLNLLRLVDWEGDFTEVEMLSVAASLIQHDYETARMFVYTDNVGFNALRWPGAINSFLEVAVNYRTKKFDSLMETLSGDISTYEADYPYVLYESLLDRPVLELWLSRLGTSSRASALRLAWRRLKEKHQMGDLYSYLYN